MALYLDSMCNDKETETRVAERNYAREILQFSIGTVWLDQTHADARQPGATIPTYDQNVILGFAKVFTGWYIAAAPTGAVPQTDSAVVRADDRVQQSAFVLGQNPARAYAGRDQRWCCPRPPRNLEREADTDRWARQHLHHPNVGPYIGRQLIRSPGHQQSTSASWGGSPPSSQTTAAACAATCGVSFARS